jgi:osmoprotectant transport system permease protein
VVALSLAVFIGVGLGVAASQSRRLGPVITGLAGVLRAIPALAIMAVMLPIIGIGFRAALVALTILAVPPILINTQAGIAAVDPSVVEAAVGMGLDRSQRVRFVLAPLAMPAIVAGIRAATVEVLASATIGAIIGAGGLGEYIFAGLSLGPAYLHLMLVGAIAVAALTLLAEQLLNGAETIARQRTER